MIVRGVFLSPFSFLSFFSPFLSASPCGSPEPFAPKYFLALDTMSSFCRPPDLSPISTAAASSDAGRKTNLY